MEIESDLLYEAHEFKNLSIEGTTFVGSEFSNCTFSKCSFKECVFEKCTFRGCSFENCDLSLASLPNSTLKETAFVKSKLTGIDWGKAAWSSKKSIHKSIDLSSCLLNFSSFFGLNLEKIIIQDCIAHDVDFSEANLSKSNLRGTDFTDSRFRQSDLQGADLVGARNYSIDPAANNIKQAKFALPEAMALLYSMDIKIEHESETESER